MPQPVKLSDALVKDARTAAQDADRSIAGQIEHWARVGRSVEAVLGARELTAIKRGAGRFEGTMADTMQREALLQAVRLALHAAGHARLGTTLKSAAKTIYGTDPAFPGCLIRLTPDGVLTPGHLVKRKFIPLLETSTTVAARSPA
jgi:hypothetical protein